VQAEEKLLCFFGEPPGNLVNTHERGEGAADRLDAPFQIPLKQLVWPKFREAARQLVKRPASRQLRHVASPQNLTAWCLANLLTHAKSTTNIA
jgi:hypothetical protein